MRLFFDTLSKEAFLVNPLTALVAVAAAVLPLIGYSDSAFVHDDDSGQLSAPTGRDSGFFPCPSG